MIFDEVLNENNIYRNYKIKKISKYKNFAILIFQMN